MGNDILKKHTKGKDDAIVFCRFIKHTTIHNAPHPFSQGTVRSGLNVHAFSCLYKTKDM